MKAFKIKEEKLRAFLNYIFDDGKWVRNNVIVLGFVDGRIIHLSWYDTMTFTMSSPDHSGYCELYGRITYALGKCFPKAKIIGAENFSKFAKEGLSISFAEEEE